MDNKKFEIKKKTCTAFRRTFLLNSQKFEAKYYNGLNIDDSDTVIIQ